MLKILIDSSKTSGMSIVQLVTGIVASVLWARYLGPEQFGLFVFAMVICSTCALIMNPSLYAAANFYLSKGKCSVGALWTTLLLCSLLVSLLASLCSYVIWTWFYGNSVQNEWLVWALFPTIITGSVLQANFSGVMYGNQKVNLITVWNTTTSIFYSVGTLIIVGLSLAPTWRVACTLSALSQLINGAGLLFLSYPKDKISPGNFSASGLRAQAKELTKYGLAVYPGRIASFLSYRIDSYFIMAMLGSSAVGIYGLATSLAELLWVLPSAISLILLPNLAKLEVEVAAKRTLNTSQIVMLIMFILAFFMACLANLLIPLLYGADYYEAYQPLLWLLPGVVSFAVAKILEPFFQSRHKPSLPTFAAIIGMLVNIVANLILIPQLGLVGAALASSISYATQVLILAYLWGKMNNRPWWPLFVPNVALER